MAVPHAERQQREVYYLGDVQGVGFRYTARSLAMRFAVAGFVRNLPDGRVYLVVEGTGDEIRAFLKAIRAEMGQYISETQEIALPYTGQFRTFDVRH
ncbi:MAG: acylphosphatase [Planctomycetaceae bacterium]|nr:acylphosphatase [Planctomycetaceae bacterium]